MKQKILSQSFFNRPTPQVAQELLGKFLVRGTGGENIAGMITEVEAYMGFDDKASHAFRGRTPRTEVMFGPPGFWYVYLIYGMYCCLNVVTEKEHFPAAVLIRSVEGITGPGRLCRHFHIDRALNRQPAKCSSGLWVEDRGYVPLHIKQKKRIGIEYAGRWKHKLWNFSINAK